MLALEVRQSGGCVCPFQHFKQKQVGDKLDLEADYMATMTSMFLPSTAVGGGGGVLMSHIRVMATHTSTR